MSIDNYLKQEMLNRQMDEGMQKKAISRINSASAGDTIFTVYTDNELHQKLYETLLDLHGVQYEKRTEGDIIKYIMV